MLNQNNALNKVIYIVVATFLVTFFIGLYINYQRPDEVIEASNEYNTAPSITSSVIPENKVLEYTDLPKYVPNRDELLDKFLDTVELMNKEKLPFDEPRTEIGQQDGFLRSKWKDAYFTKKVKYKYNGDTYYVFGQFKDTKKMYPLVPQVCSDFLVDAIDRSFGNWYYASSKRPQLVRGKFSIREEAKNDKLDLRRLNEFISYVKLHPEHFDVVFEGDGPPVGNAKFLNVWLTEGAGAQLGDLVIISGRVPWDRKSLHSHSFIISRMRDGMIDKISGNAGYSQEWNLSVESHRTPLRSVRFIIRLKDQFLEKMF